MVPGGAISIIYGVVGCGVGCGRVLFRWPLPAGFKWSDTQTTSSRRGAFESTCFAATAAALVDSV